MIVSVSCYALLSLSQLQSFENINIVIISFQLIFQMDSPFIVFTNRPVHVHIL